MSMTFFVRDPAGPTAYVADIDAYVEVDFAVLDVSDPGHGKLVVCGFHRPGGGEHRCGYDDKRLRGSDLGRAQSELTALALRGPMESAAGTVHRLGSMTVGEARLLLPSFQRAVLLAAAGSNRFEVVAQEKDDPEPSLFCTTCGEGEIYTPAECRTPARPDASCMRTDWCDQHGHSWFADRAPAAAVAS
jgi:hypothetical protein